VRLCDDRVSRRHVKVYPEGDDWHLQDLESLNGTYIENKPVDVRKVGADTVVSLDKDGPKVRLGVLMADETLRTMETLKE
jgi:pSer/pThr/pTyr-binding forkhead associated (FHA) protein